MTYIDFASVYPYNYAATSSTRVRGVGDTPPCLLWRIMGSSREPQASAATGIAI